jgi:hypothetical protein
MIKLYRVVSQQEKDDFDNQGQLRTGKNTLEAKQFFKSMEAIRQFVRRARQQQYDPPYQYLFTINIDKKDFSNIPHESMPLDDYDAISIREDNLLAFNNCIKFVKQEAL